jgi:hypothetical protein
VTAIADQLTRIDRRRLLERLDEREDTRRLMTEPGSLAAPAEPVPLHRARPTEQASGPSRGRAASIQEGEPVDGNRSPHPRRP